MFKPGLTLRYLFLELQYQIWSVWAVSNDIRSPISTPYTSLHTIFLHHQFTGSFVQRGENKTLTEIRPQEALSPECISARARNTVNKFRPESQPETKHDNQFARHNSERHKDDSSSSRYTDVTFQAHCVDVTNCLYEANA